MFAQENKKRGGGGDLLWKMDSNKPSKVGSNQFSAIKNFSFLYTISLRKL